MPVQPTEKPVVYRDYCKGYRAGDDGSVWSCWKKNGHQASIFGPWKRLKGNPNPEGYLRVTIYRNGKAEVLMVHRIVLESFVGPRPKGMQCRHFPDRNPANNRLSNIQWGTAKAQHADKVIHGTVVDNRGEKSGNAILDKAKVLEIRRRHAAGGVTRQELAGEFKIGLRHVGDIINKVCWSHV